MLNANCGSSLLVRSFSRCKLPMRVQNHLLKSWRPKTVLQYNVYHKRWNTYCVCKGINPLTTTFEHGLNFLCDLFDSGLRYSALNSARSALSCILEYKNGVSFGSHPLTVRLLKSFYNQRPPMARYSSVWNTEIVLNYLRELSPLRNLSLKLLTLKMVMLFLLATCSRQQRLISIKRSLIMEEDDGSITVRLDKLQKHSRPGRSIENIKLEQFSHDKSLCVVSCIKAYLERTNELITDKETFLCSFRAPYAKIGSQTLARWVLTIMQMSGIDTKVFKAHSTRSASASQLMNAGTPLSEILKTGGWSDECTFRRFYLRSVPPLRS